MIQYFYNQYLFSEIYLDEITNLQEDRSLISTFDTFEENSLYADRTNLDVWNESFVHELLRALRFKVEKIKANLAILKQFGDPTPISLCFSVLPEVSLDSSTMGSNYGYEIITALKKNNLRWGILTNGNKWRIYHTEETSPFENYLEIDLEAIISNQNKKAFQLIFFFLRAENFIKGTDGNCKFDIFKKESQDKISYIEDELKNALKQKEEGGQDILSGICYGYVEHLRIKGIEDFSDEKLRDEIYGGALLYMFRLLFLFYAHARDLMTEEDSEIFDNLVNNAKQYQLNGNANSSSKELWVQLRIIFGEIDRVYNGGLFNRDENQYTRFIEDATISDHLLSGVIYNMSHYEEKDGTIKPISYRDMNVRHLGTLYEGLLEHKLFVAEEDIEIKVTKKEIQFIPESQGGRIKEGQHIPKGQVYFGNDKGLRKATGSYYTPEYIVEYIVTNTVDEKLNELKEKFDKQNEALLHDLELAINDKEKKQIGILLQKNLIEFVENEILALSVLDPAMGSGHFLVNATSHIANFITSFLNAYAIESDLNTNTKYWSRRAVENCIYGVDLNILATELAKLSLWILTMAKDKPLSFLNHHLKIGNSLIGARLSDLGKYPFSKKGNVQKDLFTQDADFKSIVQQVIEDYSRIRKEDSDSKRNIETKKDYLDEIDSLLKPYKDLGDLHTSIYFGNDIVEKDYENIINNKFKSTVSFGGKYFHWELEFPGILMYKNGFDCVIGNPPYVIDKQLSKNIRYYENQYTSTLYQVNLYLIFIELGSELINSKGINSLIVPNTWLVNKAVANFRKWLLKKYSLYKIIDLTKINVFDATVLTIIYFIKKQSSKSCIKIIRINDFKDVTIQNLPIAEINENNNYLINYQYNEQINKIIKKIDSTSKKLSDFAKVSFGVKFYQKGKGNPKQTSEIVNHHSYTHNSQVNDSCKRILEGKDVDRYSFKLRENWIEYGEWLAEPRSPEMFTGKRILLRRIVGKEGLIATKIEGEFCNNSLLHIIKLTDKFISVEYLLALLNSKIIGFYFKNKYARDENTFPEIRIHELKSLKIKLCREDEKNIISELANKMIRAKSENNQSQFNKIDDLVNIFFYKLYGMSLIEINVIDEGFNLSENEYKNFDISEYL